MDQLQNAVRHDPYHRRANELLAPLLFLMGQVLETREAVARARLLAPNSLGGLIPQIVLLAHDGDLAKAQTLCEGLRPVFGTDGVEMARLLAQLIHETNGEDLQWLKQLATFWWVG